MFDPTVYENIKVVLEGAVYDLDLEGTIRVTGREDRVDIGVMDRSYALRFCLSETGATEAEIRLHASTQDLAAEILERKDAVPGCGITIRFFLTVPPDPGQACREIEYLLMNMWEDAASVNQTISYRFGGQNEGLSNEGLLNEASIDFGRTFGEEIIEDIPEMIQQAVRSLRSLIDYDYRNRDGRQHV